MLVYVFRVSVCFIYVRTGYVNDLKNGDSCHKIVYNGVGKHFCISMNFDRHGHVEERFCERIKFKNHEIQN